MIAEFNKNNIKSIKEVINMYNPKEINSTIIENLQKEVTKLDDIVDKQSQLIEQFEQILDMPDGSYEFKVLLLRRHINDYNKQNS